MAPPTGGGSSYFYNPEETEQKLDESILCNNHQSVPQELNFNNVFCGRDEEILKLEGIFRRTAASRGTVKFPPLVLVGGVSGAGKSTLVSKLKEHLSTIEEEFFWIYGKFEEVQQQPLDDSSVDSQKSQPTDTLHPFAALVDAFSAFCDELEEEEPDTLEEVRDDILEAVGQQGVLLTEMIPSLTKIIGEPEESRGESQQSQLQRFHFVFKKFIQALASNVRSVVLVLDDLNRADTASLELLLYLLKSQLKHIMFVGTYRSNEVDDEHKFIKWINNIQEAQTQQSTSEQSTTSIGTSNKPVPSAVIRIELLGMDLETINLLLSKVMSAEPDKTMSLAYIVHQKTGGNTFFVIQYLLFLNKQNLMWFDNRKNSWDWKEPAIQKEAAINTTLLDFVKDKLLHSEVAPKILPVAACIGTKFSRDMLGMILSGLAKVQGLQEKLPPPDSDIPDLLKICEKEGFIETSGSGFYSFVHDKMQEAALAVHPAVTMQQIRYETGTILYRHLNEKELDEKLFAVVNLLNVGHRRNHSVTPFELAKLNLMAAAKAKRMAAFLSSSTYVANALVFFRRHVGDGESRAFFLELCSLGAEVEVVLGHLGKTEKYCDLVFNSKYEYTIFEQLRIENVLMDKIGSIGKMSLALKRCINILGELGCPLPKTTIGKRIRAQTSLFKSRSPKNFPKVEDVKDMKLMTDTAKLEAMRLLDRAATYSHIEANKVLFTICTTRMTRWTIRYGLCDRSPPAFALLAIVLMHRMGDFEAGRRCGELAVAIMEKLRAISSESQDQTLTKSRSRATCLANAFVICWVQPLHEYQDELVAGYHSGIQVGDIESAYWNYFLNIAILFAAGRPLTELEEVCRNGASEMNAMHRRQAEIFTRVNWQGILNLMAYSPVEETTRLTGSAMNEADYFSKKDEWGSKILSNYFDNMKTILFIFFGEYEEGAILAVDRGDRFLKEAPGSPWSLGDPFFRGVCLYAAASKANKRQYYRHAEKVRATLQSWVKRGYPNAVHQLKLLDAEHEACAGKRDAAKELYESACSSATAGGFTHAAALAHVRYGEFLISSSTVGDLAEGMVQLAKAMSYLEKWGALGVVESLRERYPDINTETVF